MPVRGEASTEVQREAETVRVAAEPERPASTESLVETIEPHNIEAALRAVVGDKGAPGIDGITVKQLPDLLKARWSEIEGHLLQGRYQPQPVPE
jgi:RNA-directed DNA polymerase